MLAKVFNGNFTQQEAIPEEAVSRAVQILRSGRIHRYNTVAGETAEAVLLEQEFAAYTGARYCLAVTSGGYALATALRALGIKPDEPVLTNAFTLSPVPGAIVAAGARPFLVETTEDLTIDFADLVAKIAASRARLLLLSHMRGHIADMDELTALLVSQDVSLIEDCAHTMGAFWNGVKSGRHGLAGCYSTQTYKHINSGEGGLIVSDNAAFMARATILSGSYMLYGTHRAGPSPADFADIRLDTPNCSGRMDNLRAGILRPQLAMLDNQRVRWNERYAAIADTLRGVVGIRLPLRPEKEGYVGSSIQFSLERASGPEIVDFLARCKARGVELKWFGAPEPVGYTSRHDSWRYITPQSLPRTDAVLATLLDMRIPLTFSITDCQLIGAIIAECVKETREAAAEGRLSASGPAPLGAV